MNLKCLGAVALLSTSLGCSSKLSPEEAQEVLSDEYGSGKAQCVWSGVKVLGGDRVAFDASGNPPCPDALSAARLIKMKECTPPDAGCPMIEFEAASPARLDLARKRLTFPCGDLTLVEVQSITTDTSSNRATIKLRQAFTARDSLEDVLTKCKLEKPPTGGSDATVVVARDDGGRWSVVDE